MASAAGKERSEFPKGQHYPRNGPSLRQVGNLPGNLPDLPYSRAMQIWKIEVTEDLSEDDDRHEDYARKFTLEAQCGLFTDDVASFLGQFIPVRYKLHYYHK